MNIGEIEAEIERLEKGETTFQNCSKLAVLYSIVDHTKKEKEHVASYSYASSEFLQICSGVPYDDVLAILDEHMACIKALYPREYKTILGKIKALNRP